jgi:hypothetical protein
MNRIPLAQSAIADIESCHCCDSVQLHIGPFTLRLKPAALRELRNTLGRATESLRMLQTRPSPAFPADKTPSQH